MTHEAKITAMKLALDIEAMTLRNEHRFTAAKGIHDFMLNTKDDSLVRLYDLLTPDA